jgi:hypothetical protein
MLYCHFEGGVLVPELYLDRAPDDLVTNLDLVDLETCEAAAVSASSSLTFLSDPSGLKSLRTSEKQTLASSARVRSTVSIVVCSAVVGLGRERYDGRGLATGLRRRIPSLDPPRHGRNPYGQRAQLRRPPRPRPLGLAHR